MVIVSPLTGVIVFEMAFPWLTNRIQTGVPNYLLSGVALQVVSHKSLQMFCPKLTCFHPGSSRDPARGGWNLKMPQDPPVITPGVH